MKPNSALETFVFRSIRELGEGVYDSAENLYSARRAGVAPVVLFPGGATVSAPLFRCSFDRPVDRVSIYLMSTRVEATGVKFNPVSFVFAIGLPCIEEPQPAVVLNPPSELDAGMVVTFSGPILFRSLSIAGNVPAGGDTRMTFRILADRIGACCTPTTTKGAMVTP